MTSPVGTPMNYCGGYFPPQSVGLVWQVKVGQVFQYNAGADQPGVWVCIKDSVTYGPYPYPGSDGGQIFAPLSPNVVNEVNQLNGASGMMTVTSSDGTIIVGGAPGVGGSVDLKAVTSSSAIVIEGASAPCVGQTAFRSLDGSVSFASTGGVNSEVLFSASPLQVQSVLDAGFALRFPPGSMTPAPLVAPSALTNLVLSTQGYRSWRNNWLSAPPPEGVQNPLLLRDSTYMVTGLLALQYTLGANALLNVALNFSGADLPAPQQILQLPGDASVFQITAGADGLAQTISYVPVNVVFTVPATVPSGGVPLGIDAFASIGNVTLNFQWVGSFTVTRLDYSIA